MASAAPAAIGRVIQITGPVVDIEFPAGRLPGIYNAVEIQREGLEPLVCEVQQHLGNNWVRAVAMVWVASSFGAVARPSGPARRTRSRSSRG